MLKKSKKQTKIIILVSVAAGILLMIYLLFFAYIPKLGFAQSSTIEISEEQALEECPEIVITEYDREFTGKISENEDIKTETKLSSSDNGYEQYSLLPDVSYIVRKGAYILPAIANNTIVCNAAYGGYASRRLARAV